MAGKEFYQTAFALIILMKPSCIKYSRGVSDLKEEKLKVILINKPTKEESKQKIKELCELLKRKWHFVKK